MHQFLTHLLKSLISALILIQSYHAPLSPLSPLSFAIAAEPILLTTTAATAATAATATTTATAAMVRKKKEAKPALWVTTDEDTIIYLFGTMHALKSRLPWFNDAIKEAWDRADTLILEAKPLENSHTAVEHFVTLATARNTARNNAQNKLSLAQQMNPDDYQAYRSAIQSFGLSPSEVSELEAFGPWYVALTLASLSVEKSGFRSRHGVEKKLIKRARKDKKKLGGLENLEQQLKHFNEMDEANQIAYLNETVRNLPYLSQKLGAITAHWAAGDTHAIGAISMSKIERVNDIFLKQRNKRWANQIKAMLDTPGVLFIAVGAGHLAGKDSVQDYLHALGIPVDRVIY